MLYDSIVVAISTLLLIASSLVTDRIQWVLLFAFFHAPAFCNQQQQQQALFACICPFPPHHSLYFIHYPRTKRKECKEVAIGNTSLG
jgi:hypothetical protein